MTPSDLTRIEAIREACATLVETWADDHLTVQPSFARIAAAIRALDLARLAPATPADAATAEHPRADAETREERTP